MIRVVIRKPHHPYLEQLARELNEPDLGEVINFIIAEHKAKRIGKAEIIAAEKPPIEKPKKAKVSLFLNEG
ncbi:hypothetical protein [Iningainema tapete]|uniref:Uncharacterized protein n=1 Tax=Iningainema tapete BLCC-T55 TaxID=2748662 RepID=A0A8J6XE80_9CYAN|nr:hypothetical protein [Iningainema tapete]MBD2770666.1 hypothetical protein [Iningainema tapete BLCC-T55]